MMQVGIAIRFVKKTRKPHDCIGCIDQIKKGDSAINASGLDDDGEFYNRYTHIESVCYMAFTEVIDMVDESDISELIPKIMTTKGERNES